MTTTRGDSYNYVEELKNSMGMLNESAGVLTAWDGVTSAELDPQRVQEARKLEMKFFKEMGASTRCSYVCVHREGGKLIDMKWIDVKGDKSNPACWQRLVGREFNDHKDDSLYASTSPLEAMRIILSNAATVDPEAGEEEQREVMTNDISRAYFYAPAMRSVFMRLPQEDEEAREGEVGRLHVCLYGTRDAARGWATHAHGTSREHRVQKGKRPSICRLQLRVEDLHIGPRRRLHVVRNSLGSRLA